MQLVRRLSLTILATGILFPLLVSGAQSSIPLPRLAVVDENDRTVVMEDMPSSEGVVPVLALVSNDKGNRVEEAFMAGDLDQAKVAAEDGQSYEASAVAGASSLLVRKKQERSSTTVQTVRVSPGKLNYQNLVGPTSDIAELKRVRAMDKQELAIQGVSAAAVMTSMVHAADLKIQPPKGGFPSRKINIFADAPPIEIVAELAKSFGMELALNGQAWEFSFIPADPAREGGAPSTAAVPSTHNRELTPEETELKRLAEMPGERLHFEDIPLQKLLLALAVRSEISVILPQEELPSDDVTIRATAKPFEMLQLMASRYGLGVEYTNGLWQVFPIDIGEILPRTYRLEYADMLDFKVNAPGISSIGGDDSANASGTEAFELPDENPLVERIGAILSMPTTGLYANMEALEYIASTGGELPPSRANSRIWGVKTDEGAQAMPESSGKSEDKIHYFPESQDLVVYATRQQHQYIEQVIKALDKPQRMINYTAYIYETMLNPTSDIGIDWSKTLNQEFGISESAVGTIGEGIDLNDWQYGIHRQGIDGSPILDPLTLRAKLNLLETDSDSRLTSKPSVTSRAMRQVELGAVQRRPVEASSASVSAGGSSTSTSQLGEIKIGTMIHAIGRVLNGKMDGKEAIELYVVLEISEYVGDVLIDGNPAPITNSRNYNFTAIVPSGNTLAIGGVVRNMEVDSSTGVPVLGRIPLLGNAFSTKSKKQETMNLVAFITPTLVNDVSGNTRMEFSGKKPIDVGPELRLVSQN